MLLSRVLSLVFFGSAMFSYAQSPAKLKEPLRIQDIEDLVKSGKASSVEEVLAMLPDRYLSVYGMAFKSHSLQQASPSEPRVLLMGYHPNNAVLAFNSGNAEMAGSSSIEMLEFDESTSSFNLKHFEFSKDGKPIISETNPPLCQTCHGGKDMRPNWKQYDIWTGFYGEFDNFFNKSKRDGTLNVRTKENDLSAQKVGLDLSTDAEKTELEKFKKTFAQNSRYKYLREMEDFGDPSKTNPNFLMTVRFFKQNGQRALRLMKAHPQYPLFKYALMGTLMECNPEAINWFPEGRLKNIPPIPEDAVRDTVLRYQYIENFGFDLRKIFTMTPNETKEQAGTSSGLQDSLMDQMIKDPEFTDSFDSTIIDFSKSINYDADPSKTVATKGLEAQAFYTLKHFSDLSQKTDVRTQGAKNTYQDKTQFCNFLKEKTQSAWTDADKKNGAPVVPRAMVQAEDEAISSGHE